MHKSKIFRQKASSHRSTHIGVLGPRGLCIDVQNSRLQSLKRKQGDYCLFGCIKNSTHRQLDEHTAQELVKLRRLDIPESTSTDQQSGGLLSPNNGEISSDGTGVDIGAILSATEPLQISHAGGEFMSILLDEVETTSRCV